jgi:MFS family permease
MVRLWVTVSASAVAPVPPAPRRRLLGALRHRNYRLFFGGQLVSTIGTWMQSIAQPWLVLQLTHSAVLVALVLAVQNLPILVAGPFGGLVADRYPKRRVLQVTQAAFMVPALFLFVVTMTGQAQYWMVLLAAMAWGIIQVVDVPTRQAFSIEMVGRDDLMNAIALNSAAWNGAAVVGPTVAGLLIAVIGVPLCFLVNGLSYVAVIVSLTLMSNLPSLVGGPDRQPAFQRMREGAHYLQRDPLVGGMLLVVAAFSLFAMNRLTLIPLFADGVLRAGAAGFGFLMAALGLGALTGGLSLALFPRPASGRRQFWVGILWAASVFAFSFSRSMPVSLALLFVAGVGQTWFLATANTRIQMATPDRLRGRVMAFYAQAMMGVGPLGAMQAGVLASIFGAPAAMWVGAAACGLLITGVRIWHQAVFTLEPDDYRREERQA